MACCFAFHRLNRPPRRCHENLRATERHPPQGRPLKVRAGARTFVVGMTGLLDNIVWHTMVGHHARFATGSGGARRYARGFSPIVGFATPDDPDFDALVAHCAADEHFYCDAWSGAPPSGWQIDAETTMFKMVWEAADVPPDPA